MGEGGADSMCHSSLKAELMSQESFARIQTGRWLFQLELRTSLPLIYSVGRVLWLVTSLNICAPRSDAASKQRDSKKTKSELFFFL